MGQGQTQSTKTHPNWRWRGCPQGSSIGGNSLKGLTNFNPGRWKSYSFPVTVAKSSHRFRFDRLHFTRTIESASPFRSGPSCAPLAGRPLRRGRPLSDRELRPQGPAKSGKAVGISSLIGGYESTGRWRFVAEEGILGSLSPGFESAPTCISAFRAGEPRAGRVPFLGRTSPAEAWRRVPKRERHATFIRRQPEANWPIT
jgi:hypothetical protein